MVYCPKCGTKNEDTAHYCSNCGNNLGLHKEANWEKRLEEGAEQFGKRAEAWGESFDKNMEDECFGLPHGGTIFALILGIIIVAFGIMWMTGFPVNIWPVFPIFIGILILLGAIYSLTRKQKN